MGRLIAAPVRIAMILVVLTISFSTSPTVGSVNGSDPQPHSPILIDGDQAFTASNGVVVGDGSLLNPYVIEGWVITGSGTAVDIRNTTRFFIVRTVLVDSF